ncbi:6769_t:CDS:2 [Rhizophagus irregularis]|nr:6769_t:CDS:2 [Rhizophagus irregularis]
MQALDNKIKSDKDDEIVKSWLFEQLETTINDSSEKALYQYLYDTITESDEPSFTLKKIAYIELRQMVVPFTNPYVNISNSLHPPLDYLQLQITATKSDLADPLPQLPRIL